MFKILLSNNSKVESETWELSDIEHVSEFVVQNALPCNVKYNHLLEIIQIF